MEQKPFDIEKHMMQFCINELSNLLKASNLEQILEYREMMFKIICEYQLIANKEHPIQRLYGAILFRQNMLERDKALSLNAEE